MTPKTATAALTLRCEALGAALADAKGEARLLQEQERGQREREEERLRHEVSVCGCGGHGRTGKSTLSACN